VHTIAPGVSGSSVIIAGNFVAAGGEIVESIASYSGGVWGSLAGGIANAGCVDCAYVVYATARVGSPSSGPIFAAGTFDLAGGIPAARIARWDGQAWTALGSGIGSAPGDPFPSFVQALASYQGSLYAAGVFTRAGSLATRGIARWTGTDWVDVGGGLGVAPSGRIPSVTAMAVYDDGHGPQLYIAGIMDVVGGVPARNIARWNGASWSALGSGVGSGVNDRVWSLACSMMDPLARRSTWRRVRRCGRAARGKHRSPQQPGAMVTRRRWRGWGCSRDGRGRLRLVRRGLVLDAGGVNSPFLARWAGCQLCYANCDMSTLLPILNISDFTCFLNRFAGMNPYANCDGSTAIPTLNVATSSAI
jgi:hypothetical protein